jgi:hypothetical protein
MRYKRSALPKNKKAYSVGFTWVFGLVSLFGLGILYITFTQVFDAHLVPVIKDLTDNTTTIGAKIPTATSVKIHSDIDRYMSYFHMMPFILFFVVVIYMLMAAWRKERDSEFL